MKQELLQTLVEQALRERLFDNRGAFSPKRLHDIVLQLSEVLLAEEGSLYELGEQLSLQGLGLKALLHISTVLTTELIQLQEPYGLVLLNRRMGELLQGFHAAESQRIRAEQSGIQRALQQAFDAMNVRAQKLEVEVEERKLVAEALQKAKDAAESANRAKSQFLATMSHELRTPLNAILGYSQLLQFRTVQHGPPEILPDLERIRAAGTHLLALISDILDLSKIEADKLELVIEQVDIMTIVKDIVATTRPIVEKNGNSLSISIANDLSTIYVDPAKLRQILINLVSNAAKFSDHGRVELTMDRQTIDDAPWIRFAVRDNGIGISAEELARLFQPFTQVDSSSSRKYGGTGLGLAISRRLAQLMGGEIIVQSQPGQGSTFTLVIPIGTAERQSRIASSSMRTAPMTIPPVEDGEESVVLVIDDEIIARDLLARYLSRDGFQLVLASSGKEGLVLARQWHPAVITLDVLMPEMDGWAVLAALKADPELHNIPVIMLTMVEDRNTGFALGASDYLTKPINYTELLGTITKYCLPRDEEDQYRILVVEDDQDTREVLCRILEQAGYLTSTAWNGRLGIEFLEQTRPDLILLDLMMPEMDGFQFVNEIHAHPEWHNIPIIVVTAMELSQEDRRRLNSHIEQILQKGSYSREELLENVRRHVFKIIDGS